MSLTRLKQGFQIGESYLSATSDTQAGLAHGDFPLMTWVLGGTQQDPRVPASAGNDLSINGGTTSEIDIATTGWYQACVVAVGEPDNASDTFTGFEPELQRISGGSGAGPPIFNGFLPGSFELTDHSIYVAVTTPPWLLQAGDKVGVFLGAYLSTPANTWTTSSCMLNIVRLA